MLQKVGDDLAYPYVWDGITNFCISYNNILNNKTNLRKKILHV